MCRRCHLIPTVAIYSQLTVLSFYSRLKWKRVLNLKEFDDIESLIVFIIF